MSVKHLIFYAAGSVLAFAYDDLSVNKVATESPTIILPIYEAKLAVDRDIKTCMRTDPIAIDGVEKKTWWKVDLGRISNLYSITILFRNYDGYEMRQRGRFAGFSLYVSNTNVTTIDGIKNSTLCYKDGPHLPPLNFTINCTAYGRYVIFFNERSNVGSYPSAYQVKNVYTELCEVFVEGCNKPGFYGITCDTQCPSNCKYSTCHIELGNCFACKPGWTGNSCYRKCEEGWYGINCSQPCEGHCRDGITCNHVTGVCDGECDAGWKGFLCDKGCDDGTFGYNCVNKCSDHCFHVSPCNKQTGHCEGGCAPGYTNDDCSDECSPSYYGKNCRQRCSGHCINNEACDHVSGVCSNGCQDGLWQKYLREELFSCLSF